MYMQGDPKDQNYFLYNSSNYEHVYDGLKSFFKLKLWPGQIFWTHTIVNNGKNRNQLDYTDK